MALDSTAATAAATAFVDAFIAANPSFNLTHVRSALIADEAARLLYIFNAITANAVVLPNGSPVMAAGGDNVTGKGTIT